MEFLSYNDEYIPYLDYSKTGVHLYLQRTKSNSKSNVDINTGIGYQKMLHKSRLLFGSIVIPLFSILIVGLLPMTQSVQAQTCGSFDYIPFVRTGGLGQFDPNTCVDDIVTSWSGISSTWTGDTANTGVLSTGPGTTAGEEVCYTGGTNSWHTAFNNSTPLPSNQSGCISFVIPEDQYDGHFVVGMWKPNGTTWGTAACQIYFEGNTLINSWRIISVIDNTGSAISTGWQTANWTFPFEAEVCFDATNQEFSANFDADGDGAMEEVARGDACFCEEPVEPVCPYFIKKVGEADICSQINGDASHPLASLDCDGGGKDNITECAEGLDPSDPSDDVVPCNLGFDMSYTFNDQGVCRFFVDLDCDDSTCPVTSWDYEITAGTESITGTSTSTLNAPTSNSFRPSVLGCGNEIRIDREDFANAFPGGFGEDITFTMTANSSSCGCTETSSVVIPRMRAMTFDNQGPQRDATGTTSWIDGSGNYVNGSATATSSWPLPPPLPNWGVGGPTFIDAAYVQTGDLVCAPVGWAQMLAAPGLSICEVTLDDGTVITLPTGCAVPATGSVLATTIAAALNVCTTFLDHPSIDGNGLCSAVGTQYDGNLTDGVHGCVNWNFMYSTYAVSTFKICEDASGTVVGEFVFGDASVDYGY